MFFENTFVTVGDNGAIWQSDAFTEPSPASGFAAWRSAFFPGLPPGSAADEDYDADGIANLIEYATGSDPTDAASALTLAPPPDGGYLTLTIPKSPLAGDVLFSVERSTDLQTWSTDGTVVVSDTPSALTVRCASPIAGAPRAWLRGTFTLIP